MLSQTRRARLFDPLDPAFLDDPYPFYARLRDIGPMVRDGATQWVAARYDQVAYLLRDPRLHSDWPEAFQQMRMGEGAACDFLRRVLLHREGANHVLLRRLLNAAMHETSGPQWREIVRRVVDAQLDQAFEAGQLDIISDLALPVPIAVACDMLGVPAADRHTVSEWGLQIIKAFTVILPEEDRPEVHRAIEEMRAYLDQELLRTQGTDKLAVIFAAMQHGSDEKVERAELIDNLIFLLVSGFTTTVHAIAAVGGVLLGRPEIYEQLRADRSLVRATIEECMRYEAPIQHISRYAVEPIQLDGITIRPGRVVHLLLGSANRDERRFDDPDRVNIRREPNQHLSFGAGIHACLGAGLGRLETAVVLERLLDRCAVLVADREPVRQRVQVFRSYASLPARIAP